MGEWCTAPATKPSTSRPRSSRPSGSGTPRTPRAGTWRSSAWIVSVHGPVARRTVAPTRSAPVRLSPVLSAAVRRTGRLDRPAQEDRPRPRRVALGLARHEHLAEAADRRLERAAGEEPPLLVLAGEEPEPLRLAGPAVQPDAVAAALRLRQPLDGGDELVLALRLLDDDDAERLEVLAAARRDEVHLGLDLRLRLRRGRARGGRRGGPFGLAPPAPGGEEGRPRGGG